MMFALLKHDTRQCDPAVAEPGLHWDLLIEFPDQDRLPTWQLAADPTETANPITARRIPDHRRLYLDYEGEITGGRGTVRRIDRGHVQIVDTDLEHLVINFAGTHLRGSYLLETTPAGPSILKRCTADQAGR